MWVQPLAQEDPLEEEMTTCLENSLDRGVWWATVHRVTESDTTDYLSMHTCSRNERMQGERIKERVNKRRDEKDQKETRMKLRQTLGLFLIIQLFFSCFFKIPIQFSHDISALLVVYWTNIIPSLI